jgi:hypothetical protein
MIYYFITIRDGNNKNTNQSLGVVTQYCVANNRRAFRKWLEKTMPNPPIKHSDQLWLHLKTKYLKTIMFTTSALFLTKEMAQLFATFMNTRTGNLFLVEETEIF